MSDHIFVGGGGKDYSIPQNLLLEYANRHGMIAGATGTGKTVTLQILAEGFSNAGVPVFLSDVKSDLSGMAKSGSKDFKLNDAFQKRAKTIGYDDYVYQDFPVVFWDVFGKKGHPIRTTVSEIGPLLLSRLLQLTDAQEGVINIAFKVADDQGLKLLDLKDLRALLIWVSENAKSLTLEYGYVTGNTVGTILRRILTLQNEGADMFFGEPALELSDLISVGPDGRGRVNILASDELMESPRLYSTMLLWLLSELFEELPEVGDLDKPKIVFFFDEAHLLFDNAPDVLVNKVEQVARLIRSKGVGIYFISQNPADVPMDILGQLGNRIQHALRAFTPRDQKGLQAAANSFRSNPNFKTTTAIKEVGVGEAVVSLLEAKGVPSIAERTLIRPPSSQLGPITDEERMKFIETSPIYGKYDEAIDRDSAFEILTERADSAAKEAEEAEQKIENDKLKLREFKTARRYDGNEEKKSKPRSRGNSDSIGTAFVKSFARSLGTRTGRTIVRGIMGSMFKGR